ncbi:hypothetical protein CHS0354_019497 [Potamilus streckersoni]|uniref:Uncharacterized protein n=1 Tax=Potamilus streckersoni TaxID=2493646 RepID=A0AAE0SHT3_9BIVA|nr:hypothetical protein CHS0354_019497 [Potamilus streckersoni]
MLLVGLVAFGCGRRAYKHRLATESVFKKVIIDCYKYCKGSKDEDDVSSSDVILHQDVATVFKFLPVYGFVAIYWMSNSQSSTSLFLQSVRLDIGMVPPALLTTFNPVMVVLFIPLMDRFVYPMLTRFGKTPSLLQRIGK